jgi:hypothetical protein
MTNNASNAAKDISRLKMIVAEKESIIDTMQGDYMGRTEF